MNSTLLKAIEQNFEARLQKKTGWGKNEVMQEYKEAVLEVVLDSMDKSK
jgi:hypothetical protein